MNKEDRIFIEELALTNYTPLNHVRRLIAIIDRLDKQNQKILALLERWVSITKAHQLDRREFACIKKAIDDTETLLKALKEE